MVTTEEVREDVLDETVNCLECGSTLTCPSCDPQEFTAIVKDMRTHLPLGSW